MSDLTLAEAQAMLAAITAAAQARGKAVVVAVSDRHGELIAFSRMASGLLAAITIAQNKAYTAARLNRATRVRASVTAPVALSPFTVIRASPALPAACRCSVTASASVPWASAASARMRTRNWPASDWPPLRPRRGPEA